MNTAADTRNNQADTRNEQDAPVVVGLGELIWDFLPSGKQLGGAPTNFAYISRLLGNQSQVASRIGNDELGDEALARLERMNISTACLQRDALHPTGTVRVTIDGSGEALFAMNENSAWDYLEWTEAWAEFAPRADAVCFGTLGQRRAQARDTMLRFLQNTRAGATRIFDVNLRHSFFDAAMLRASLELATIIKLNSDELATVATMLQFDEREEEALALRLIAMFKLELVAITRGKSGSLLVSATEAFQHTGLHVRVTDTIGAGDAFSAALAHFHLRRAPLKTISEAANRLGAWVATHAGATPEANAQTITEMLGDLSGFAS